MGIVNDVRDLLLAGEAGHATTGRTAKDIARLLVKYFRVRSVVELDSLRMRVTTIEAGSFQALEAYRRTVDGAKERIEEWAARLEREIEES